MRLPRLPVRHNPVMQYLIALDGISILGLQRHDRDPRRTDVGGHHNLEAEVACARNRVSKGEHFLAELCITAAAVQVILQVIELFLPLPRVAHSGAGAHSANI